MKFYSALDAIRDTYIYKDSIDVSKTGVDCILDTFCESNEPTLSFKDGLISVCGSLKVTMLLKDTLGSIVTIEKMLDFCYERKSDCGDVHTESQPEVTISSFECVLKNKDQIDVKAEMQINCSVFGETEIDVVTEICEGKATEKRSNSAITVYFPKCEESLWDIAKRYNTTVNSIAIENNLEGDTTGEIKMLFIPSA